MTQRSFWWDGTTVGDAASAPYASAAGFGYIFRILLNSDRTTQGVIAGYLNELAVTAGAASVSVASGAAFGSGKFFESDAAESLALTNPAVTRTDLICIQQVNATQTCRLYVHENPSESVPAPAPTQSTTVWETPLATATIVNGGAVTVTDSREMLRHPAGAGAEYKNDPGDDSTMTADAWNDIAGCQITLTKGMWLVMGAALVQDDALGTAGNRYLRIYNSTDTTQIAMGGDYFAGAGADIKSLHVRPTVVDLAAASVLKLQLYALTTGDTVYGTAGTGLDRAATGITAIRVTE